MYKRQEEVPPHLILLHHFKESIQLRTGEDALGPVVWLGCEMCIRDSAKVRHRGRTTCLVNVDILGEGGKLLATGEFTYFCIDPDIMAQKDVYKRQAHGRAP